MVCSAPLLEVFSSIQGEGRFVGRPMAFVRTARCPIRCLYCDTPESFEVPAECAVHAPGGVRAVANPVSAEAATQLVSEVAPDGRPVSITGGEPLLHAELVGELGALLRGAGRRVHLETAALHPQRMREVIAVIDHLSADYKLPGTLERGDPRAAHRACLAAAAASAATIDVKLVVTPAVALTTVATALDDLAPLRERITLVLQPVTPARAVDAAPSPAVVQAAADRAVGAGFTVLVLPQVHPQLGVR